MAHDRTTVLLRKGILLTKSLRQQVNFPIQLYGCYFSAAHILNEVPSKSILILHLSYVLA